MKNSCVANRWVQEIAPETNRRRRGRKAASSTCRAAGARCKTLLRMLSLCLAVLSHDAAVAETGHPGDLCDAAAHEAAQATGVPLRVMRAVTRTETGRTRHGRFSPWPWTINHDGDGRWFDSRADALSYLRNAHGSGGRNIDVGCFQINLRWHGQAFSDLEDMLSPRRNARYAASFLSDLHREFGNWEAAVGAFHSRTPRHAERYLARYRRIHADLAPHRPAAADLPRRERARAEAADRPARRGLDLRRRTPLLAGSASDGLGSLARPLLSDRPAGPLWEITP